MAEKLIFATSNQGKLREIRSILGDLGLEVISMAQAGFHDEIEENGTCICFLMGRINPSAYSPSSPIPMVAISHPSAGK